MIVCVSEAYLTSRHCQLEIEYGFQKQMPLIVVKLDPASNIAGHIVLASQIYVSTFCQGCHLVKNLFSYKVMMIKSCVTKYWIVSIKSLV